MEPCSEVYQNNEEPDDTVVRQLVLDYLIHNCYGETAQVFFRDALNVSEPSIEHGSSDSAQNGITNGTTNGVAQNVRNDNGTIPMDIEVDEDGDCEMVDSIQEDCMHVDSTDELIYKEVNSSKLLEVLKKKQSSNGYDESFNDESALKSLEIRKSKNII
jgi:hypothetical protein